MKSTQFETSREIEGKGENDGDGARQECCEPWPYYYYGSKPAVAIPLSILTKTWDNKFFRF